MNAPVAADAAPLTLSGNPCWFNGIGSEFSHRITHRHDIPGRHIRLDIVYGAGYVSPSRAKLADAEPHLLADFLRCPIGQDVVGVDTSPESHTIPIVGL